jgi:hypothetical protein
MTKQDFVLHVYVHSAMKFADLHSIEDPVFVAWRLSWQRPTVSLIYAHIHRSVFNIRRRLAKNNVSLAYCSTSVQSTHKSSLVRSLARSLARTHVAATEKRLAGQSLDFDLQIINPVGDSPSRFADREATSRDRYSRSTIAVTLCVQLHCIAFHLVVAPRCPSSASTGRPSDACAGENSKAARRCDARRLRLLLLL